MKEEKIIENGIELKKKTYYYGNGAILREEYYLSNGPHRENKPTTICYYESGDIEREIYFLNGKCHREDGPAIIYYNENNNIEEEYYFLNGIQITDDLQLMVIKGLNKV